MPTHDHPALGTPIWIELNTTDVEGARRFYAGLFGWESEEPNPEFGGYLNFTRAGARIAGGMNMGGAEWHVYLATEDATKIAEVAAAHGARVDQAVMDVGDMGRMAVLSDPGGARTGLWQPGSHPGFVTYAEPGAPSWFELHTSDFQGSLAFYRDVFGLESMLVSDTDEFRYAVLSANGQQVAGVADDSAHLAAGASSWRVYLWTEDVDASAAKVTELGGKVLRPAEDTPWGRLAEVSDPAGVVFSLQAANDQMPAN
jgi:uncharacterized protein